MGRHQTLRSMANLTPTQTRSSSEAEVQAFADGLLGPERAADVRRYMESWPEEARRIAFYGRLEPADAEHLSRRRSYLREESAAVTAPGTPERPPRRDLRVLRRIGPACSPRRVAAGALFVLRVPEASSTMPR